MTRTQIVLRGALVVGAIAAFVACGNDTSLLGPTPRDPLFASYVSLGNSITAGFQSDGINDSTQRQSYALLLARSMNTRYAYPSLAAPGCRPPLTSLTGTRVGGATSSATTCAYRTPSSINATITNVAVPNAASIDPTSATTLNSTPLTTLFLGGETMVQKALDNRPTFATIWIGNNDILGPAIGGFPSAATPQATFVANYSKMMSQLLAGAPNLKGVLIGIVQVAQVPQLVQAGVIATTAGAGGAAALAGRSVSLDPATCTGANLGALFSVTSIASLRARTTGTAGVLYCQKTAAGGPTDPGDGGVLDIAEQATVAGIVSGYNAYIKAKADSIGFAYYDPNVTLGALKADGVSIPAFPILTSTTAPFGTYFSLDGVHPAQAAHVLLANGIIDAINKTYGTSLTKF